MQTNYFDILQNQKKYFETGITKRLSFRVNQLKALRLLIINHESEILAAVYKDLSKPDFENQLTETQFTLWEISHAIKMLKSWIVPENVPTPLFHQPAKSIIYSEPLGQALIIAPWNYPFQLLISPLVAAIAAGNTVLLKPSEISVNTSAMIAKLIPQYFNEEYIAVVEGGVKETEELLDLKWDAIFYTGSTKVGKIIMSAAAKNLTPVTLELGGKSPCIVDKNINLKQTARKIIWGKFLNAGQTCIAPDYILVDKMIKDKLVNTLIEIIKEFYGENPQNSKDYARIINETHFNRLTSYLKDTEIVYGGNFDVSQKYISPTIILNPNLDSDLMNDEIFGPILPIIEYQSIDEAISFINKRPKPLALYVFSKNSKFNNEIIDKTSSGGVCVNDTLSHITTSSLPFGGVGDSGMGQYHAKAGFDNFSHKKSVLKKSQLIDYKLRYPPYLKLTPFLKKIITWLN